MKLSKSILIISIIFSSIIICQANKINVPSDYSKIQEAIEASTNGDSILVSPGIYYENINFRGKEIVVSSLFYINQDLSYLSNTIIDGGSPTHEDSASVVIFSRNETNNSILQGFTITNGTGTRTYNNNEGRYFRTGGGILINRASPVIQNNIVIKNKSINKSNVDGAGGGGIRAGQSKALIINNIITENEGGYAGGIMLAFSAGLTFKNNVVSKNIAKGDFGGGSGIYIDWEAVQITNCTIVDNYSGNYGGAICVTGTTNKFVNCIIYDNTSNSTVRFKQFFMRSNGDAVVHYSNVIGGYDGYGNIDTDPLFEERNFYQLSSSSPCIDGGNPAEVHFDPSNNNGDEAKYPALGKRKNDMGAYGGPNCKTITTKLTSVEQDATIPQRFNLKQNYPNPFNPTTIIDFEISNSASSAKLLIYDNLGKEVKQIYSGKLEAGKHTYLFEPKNLSSGIYYYSLQVDEYSDTKKMIFLK